MSSVCPEPILSYSQVQFKRGAFHTLDQFWHQSEERPSQNPSPAGGLEEIPQPTADELAAWLDRLSPQDGPAYRLYKDLQGLPRDEQRQIAETVAKAYRVYGPHFRETADYLVRTRGQGVAETKPDGSPVLPQDKQVQQWSNDLTDREFPGMAIVGEEQSRIRIGARWWITRDPLDGTTNYEHRETVPYPSHYLSTLTMLYRLDDGRMIPLLTIIVAPEYRVGDHPLWEVAGLGIDGALINGQPVRAVSGRPLRDLVAGVGHLPESQSLNEWYLPAMRVHAHGVMEYPDSMAMFEIPLSVITNPNLPGTLVAGASALWDAIPAWHVVEALDGAVLELTTGHRFQPTFALLVPGQTAATPALVYAVSERAARDIVALRPAAGMEEHTAVTQDLSQQRMPSSRAVSPSTALKTGLEDLVPQPPADELMVWLNQLTPVQGAAWRLYGALKELPEPERRDMVETVAKAYQVYGEHMRGVATYLVKKRPAARSTLKEDHSPVTRQDKVVQEASNQLTLQMIPGASVLGEERGIIQPDARWWIIRDPIDGTEDYLGRSNSYLSALTMVYRDSLGRVIPALTMVVAPEYLSGEPLWLVAGLGVQGVLVNGQPVASAIPGRSLREVVGSISRIRNNEAINQWYEPILRQYAGRPMEGLDNYPMYEIPLSVNDPHTWPGTLAIRPLRLWDAMPGWHLVEALGGMVVDLETNERFQLTVPLLQEGMARRAPPLLYAVSEQAAREIVTLRPAGGLEERPSVVVLTPSAFGGVAGLLQVVQALQTTAMGSRIVVLSGAAGPEEAESAIRQIRASSPSVVTVVGTRADPIGAFVTDRLDAAGISVQQAGMDVLRRWAESLLANLGRLSPAGLEQAADEFVTTVGLEQAA